MAIQQFVSSEDLKKLVDDKIISTNNIKHILKKLFVKNEYKKASDAVSGALLYPVQSEYFFRIYFAVERMQEKKCGMNFSGGSQFSSLIQ